MISRKTFFIVDDDADIRFLIKSAIIDADIDVTVIEAENGLELLMLLDNHADNSLIFLDLNMPRMDGYETLAALKSNPLLRHLPVIVLSTIRRAESDKNSIFTSLEQFITKPSSYPEWVAIVKTAYACF